MVPPTETEKLDARQAAGIIGFVIHGCAPLRSAHLLGAPAMHWKQNYSCLNYMGIPYRLDDARPTLTTHKSSHADHVLNTPLYDTLESLLYAQEEVKTHKHNNIIHIYIYGAAVC